MEREGAWWLSKMLRGAVEKYRQEALIGDVDGEFLEAFRETLGAAVATVEDVRDSGLIERAIEEGFGVGRPHL